MADLLRSTAFRWALGIALWTVLFAAALFAFVYWQTAGLLRDELAETLRLEIRAAAADPALTTTRVETWIAMDPHATHYGGVFAPDGTPRLGNVAAFPAGLSRDGDAVRVPARIALAGRGLDDVIWAAALSLPNGDTALIGHDADELDRMRDMTLRALGLALAPTLVLAMAGGLFLADRGRRRLAATEAALDRVMQGDLRHRLPVGARDDEFARLARNVNRMLDRIEHLMAEIRSVGDAVAHDLRTPLTRLRTRLERSRDQARSLEELRLSVDQGLAWIDQTLGMVTAVLRIGEMEDSRRRAAFGPLDLAALAAEAVELFEPLAEERGLRLRAVGGPAVIQGDRDLCGEVLANLLDNAIKFTPPGGEVRVLVEGGRAHTVLAVEDTGPGIPEPERAQVFRRFYRADAARHTAGHGLGLGLVAAIAQVHGATAVVTDAPGGGCRVEVRFGGG
ncbi:ATP-binding protein [Methylobacterium aerolatum]|uniref:histidine kinase n=1 Tax=Methylobacterium aerolatum TaxID=418708 RepID=A0ABU0HW26_9HYPH|nr:ATP-binding protein [Methylobacterium aerolatum]MDQ0446543.1 signal transduction histidine kinase [Methylobacterium aerolatum]GJD33296.1 Adaptive-response sensory-kinase SasA [Methylobacterium aerolatum]